MGTKKTQRASALQDCTDEELVALSGHGLRAGSEAFSVLARRHRAELLQRCRMRLGNAADAEDVVQESLIRAYRALGRFEGSSSFRTWLFAIAENQCKTCHARRMRHMLSEHVRALIVVNESRESGADRPCDSTEECVRRVLGDMPAPARDVLMLRYYSELSLEEIATTLGIGLSACKMRLYRALGRLEGELEQALPT